MVVWSPTVGTGYSGPTTLRWDWIWRTGVIPQDGLSPRSTHELSRRVVSLVFMCPFLLASVVGAKEREKICQIFGYITSSLAVSLIRKHFCKKEIGNCFWWIAGTHPWRDAGHGKETTDLNGHMCCLSSKPFMLS